MDFFPKYWPKCLRPVAFSIAGATAAGIAAAAAAASAAAGIAGAATSASGQKAAEGKAAQAQQFASQQALEAQREGAYKSNQVLADAAAQARNDLSPYYQIGLDSATQLRNRLEYEPWSYGMAEYKQDPGYTPMVTNLEQLQATPGYQFRLEQGQQSANNSAAARGSLLSGGTLKELTRFGQGLASTEFQNAWDRSQQAYQAAFSRGLATQTRKDQNQARVQSVLGGLVGYGANAAGAMANAGMSSANQIANVYGNLGRDTANINQQQGQIAANQANAIGNANSQLASNVTGAVQGAIGNYTLGQYLNNPTARSGRIANTSSDLYPDIF